LDTINKSRIFSCSSSYGPPGLAVRTLFILFIVTVKLSVADMFSKAVILRVTSYFPALSKVWVVTASFKASS